MARLQNRRGEQRLQGGKAIVLDVKLRYIDLVFYQTELMDFGRVEEEEENEPSDQNFAGRRPLPIGTARQNYFGVPQTNANGFRAIPTR